MKIKLCENSKHGHHGIYLESLLKLKETQECYINKKLFPICFTAVAFGGQTCP